MKISSYLIAPVLALALTVSAKAQFISWSQGTITSDSAVQAVGTLVDAYAFNYGGSSFTVNGITFTEEYPSGGTSTAPGYTLTGPSSGPIDGTGGGIVPTSGGGLDSNLSGNLQILLGNGVHNYGGGQSLELTGLTNGTTYSLQLFLNANANDARSQAYSDGSNTSATVTVGGNNYGNTGAANGGTVPGYNPAYLIETFKATGTTETINAVNSGTAAQLSGFTLEEVAVPEPSTYALMGLGLVGLVFLARRQAVRA